MHLTVASRALWLGLGAEMGQRGLRGPPTHGSREAGVWQAGVGTPSIPGGRFRVGVMTEGLGHVSSHAGLGPMAAMRLRLL